MVINLVLHADDMFAAGERERSDKFGRDLDSVFCSRTSEICVGIRDSLLSESWRRAR